jgi:Leucine-rich repeat (LRR) protein
MLKLFELLPIILIIFAGATLARKITLSCDVERDGDTCVFVNQTTSENDRVTIESKHLGSTKDTNVTKIQFKSCSLFSIPASISTKFRNLKNILAGEINLESIEPKMFQNFTKTSMSVSFDGNRFRKITRGAFTGSNIFTLSIANNKLVEIYKETFDWIQGLISLDLSGNQIKNIHREAFKKLTGLFGMVLANNKLEFLHKDLFLSNTKLNTFDLSGNQIKVANNKMFSHLNSLTGLNLLSNTCVDKHFKKTGLNNIQKLVEDGLKNCMLNYEGEREKYEKNDNFNNDFDDADARLDELNRQLTDYSFKIDDKIQEVFLFTSGKLQGVLNSISQKRKH